MKGFDNISDETLMVFFIRTYCRAEYMKGLWLGVLFLFCGVYTYALFLVTLLDLAALPSLMMQLLWSDCCQVHSSEMYNKCWEVLIAAEKGKAIEVTIQMMEEK